MLWDDVIERVCRSFGRLLSYISAPPSHSASERLKVEASSNIDKGGAGFGSLKMGGLLLLDVTEPRFSRGDVLAKRAHQLFERCTGRESGEFGFKNNGEHEEFSREGM